MKAMNSNTKIFGQQPSVINLNLKLKQMNKFIYIITLAAVFGTGCKKSFLDVNTNPNALPTATPAFVISNAINQTASGMVGPNELGMFWSGHWTQSNGYILSTTLFKYEFTNNDFNYWDGTYDNLQDYKFVLDNADGYSQKYLVGPAKIMMAYQFQKLVDMYGNIPFSEALKGVSNLAPKFDDQKSVYAGLITWLDGAIKDCKDNSNFASQYASYDIVFKGNLTKWIKFANSLKLRILMKQSKVSGAGSTIVTEINKILATKPVQDRIQALGGEALPLSPAQFAAKAAEDSKRFGAIIRERKITGD